MRNDIDKARALALAGKHAEAEQLLRQLPHSPRVAFNLGWHLMRRGHWRAGMERMQAGRVAGVFGSPPLPGEIWDFQPLVGKTVLLNGEGGYGDHIINVRWAHNLKVCGAKTVIASGPEELLPVLAACKGVDKVAAHENVTQNYDYWVPAMSGPYYFPLDHKDYLEPPHGRKPLKRDFTVGICWKGNPEFEHEQHRRFPVEPLFKLTELCKVVSFQKDCPQSKLPKGIRRAPMGDWAVTASELTRMDLVISSCTAVAHLAAAMGLQTWVIVPRCPYYVWALPLPWTPWYMRVTLYRQEEDWPLKKLQKDLALYIHTDRKFREIRRRNSLAG